MVDPSLPHRGRCRGHDVTWNPVKKRWHWTDTGEEIDTSASLPSRPCAYCGKTPTAEGHDACLGNIPGAIQACCGHGKDPGYILWTGMRVSITGNTDWLSGIRVIE